MLLGERFSTEKFTVGFQSNVPSYAAVTERRSTSSQLTLYSSLIEITLKLTNVEKIIFKTNTT